VIRNLERRLEKLELLLTGAGKDLSQIVIVLINEDDDESVILAKREEKMEEFWREHPELDPASTRIGFIHIVLVSPKGPGTLHDAGDG
jgi:hypothetical protein